MRLVGKTLVFLLVSVLLASCGLRTDEAGLKLYQEGRYQDAIDYFDKFLVDRPEDANAYYNRGRSYEELGDLENAEADFKKAVMFEPKEPLFKMSLGICQFKQKNYSYTVGSMEQILKANDRDINAYILKGRAHSHIGEIEQAIEAFDAAVRIDGQNGEAYLHRGRILAVADASMEGGKDLKTAKNLGVKGAEEFIARLCK